MSDDGDKVRGFHVFTCPAPEHLGCRLTKKACALRHLLRMRIGAQKVASSPAHLKVCSGCHIGQRHADELGLGPQAPVRVSAVRMRPRKKR